MPTTAPTRGARLRLAAAIAAGLAGVTVIVLFVLGSMLTGEYWCSDRSPWWGPPQDPESTCTGEAWASDHPGEYPWTMPR